MMTIGGTERSLCIMELNVICFTGIGVELPSLELNCLRDFVPESELNWNCFYRNWNLIAKKRIDPGSVLTTCSALYDYAIILQ